MQSEKELFIQMWEREYATTLKVLKNYPQERQNYRPHERSMTARELAWLFVMEEQTLIGGALVGNIEFSGIPPAPENMSDILHEYEKKHHEVVEKVKNTAESELQKTMKFMVAAKTVGDVRRMDILWLALHDHIHHRGQFSVYLRSVNGKVPSIYGPSADEPWM